MVNKTCAFSQSESGKYFGWIIGAIKCSHTTHLTNTKILLNKSINCFSMKCVRLKRKTKWLRRCSPLPRENKLSQLLPYTKVFLYLVRVYTLFCSRNCISQLTHAAIVRFSDLAGIISLQFNVRFKNTKNLFWSTVSSSFISYGVSYFLLLRCSFMINVK